MSETSKSSMGANSAVRLHVVAGAYALWLFGTFVVFYLAHAHDETALQISVICGLLPAACQLMMLGVEWRGLVAPVKIWLAFLLVILLSYVVNVADPLTAPTEGDGVIPAAWTPLVYTINAVFVMAIGTLVAGCPDRRLLRTIASHYCVLATPFLIYIDLTGERVWGRLTAGLQPNMWGIAGLTVCLGAFARKLGPVAIISFATGVALILASSSRENLLSVAITLLLVTALYLKELTGPRWLIALTGVSGVLVAAALLLDPYILDAIAYVKSDILLLGNAQRGLGSGFSGRNEVWAAAIGVWLRSPLLGIGFRQHERFMPEGLEAHNSYLAMLADTGILGLVVYLALLIGSLAAAWGIRDQRTRRFVLAVIVGYMVSGLFDRRTIDPGNPYSLFFLMCCSVALADRSLRRVAALWGRLPASAHPALPAG